MLDSMPFWVLMTRRRRRRAPTLKRRAGGRGHYTMRLDAGVAQRGEQSPATVVSR
jgi:hypothetical protein